MDNEQDYKITFVGLSWDPTCRLITAKMYKAIRFFRKICLKYTLSEHFIRYLLDFFFTLKSSAAVAYPLRGLTHCVFRDALLHTTLVICITITFLSASTSLTLFLWTHSLATCFCLQNCCSLGVFLFFTPFSANSRDMNFIVHENPRRSTISEILKPPCLAPTIIPRSKLLWSHSFPILKFGLKNHWTSWTHLHAFMHLVVATWLAD